MPVKRTAVNIVNAINNTVRKQYNVVLPTVTDKTFNDMASALRTAPSAVVNAWEENLINLVGMQVVKNKRQYESYFRKLHKGEIPTFDIQLEMTDLINARVYSPEANANEFFEDDRPDVATQYANQVLKVFYPVSINEESLIGAFLNTSAFDKFLQSIQTSLYSSLEQGDVDATKELIAKNIEEGNIRIETCPEPKDKDTALAFGTKLKTISRDMATEMSNEYNLSGLNTWTPQGEGVTITTNDVEAVAENYNMAWAFNASLLDLTKTGELITTKSNGLAGGKVYAIYADNDAFEIRTIIGFPKVRIQEFGNTLTKKEWLHNWALYTISYFNNAVAFADPSKVGVAAITLDTEAGTKNVDRGKSVKVKVKSVKATEGKIADKFGTYAVAGATDSDTVIDVHSGKLTIGKNETAKTLTVTFTSHLDNTKTADIAITVNGN